VAERAFYVGYQPRAEAGLARFQRRVALGVLLAALGAGAGWTALHRLRPAARFEFGAPRPLTGRVLERPYPFLMLPRPGGARAPGVPADSGYPLVGPWKSGAEALVAGREGQQVELQATLAYRDGRVVAEVVPGSLRELAPAEPGPGTGLGVSLGRHTLVGEIVDSKCFFGVMNPGELKPHRACAVRCISGGIPPVLCVRGNDGRALYLLLVSEQGLPVHQAVLDRVAEPLEISGEVRRLGDFLVLFSDPETYRRHR